jgi:hypothetical protein
MKKLCQAVLFTAILLSPLYSQLPDWTLGGYLKDLVAYTDGPLEGFPLETGNWQNTFQVRVNAYAYPAERITFSLQVRNLWIYQKNMQLIREFQNFFTVNSYYFNFKWEWLENDNYYGFSEIDRLYFDWVNDDSEVLLGRQRIAWGTCLVWNPTDLFNPFDILDFDYEERPGTDALHFQYYTGPLSQFNLAATPGRTRYEVIYAGRYATNKWNYDFGLIAGWQRNSLRLAVNWAGQFLGGGFRGEILFTSPNLIYTTINLETLQLETIELTNPYLTFALSYDYTFPGSFYTHTEYLYNGLGTTGKAGSRRFDIVYTGELSPARQSLFQEFAYLLTPLIRTGFFVIFNPNDKSWIAAPSLQYSLATNWEVYLLIFPAGGEKGTEYGGYPTQYFARIKFSF